MNRLVVAASTLLLPAALSANVLADEPAQLPLGTRLRVVTHRSVIGRLVAQDEQSLTLQTGGGRDPVVVPRSAIIRVQKSVAPSQRGVGAVGGLVLGALSATVFGLAVGENCSDRHSIDTLCFGRGGVMLASAAILVPLGMVIGVAAAPGERWEEIPVRRFAVNVRPRRGRGIAASVTFRF
jgi:hypothetical protein